MAAGSVVAAGVGSGTASVGPVGRVGACGRGAAAIARPSAPGPVLTSWAGLDGRRCEAPVKLRPFGRPDPWSSRRTRSVVAAAGLWCRAQWLRRAEISSVLSILERPSMPTFLAFS